MPSQPSRIYWITSNALSSSFKNCSADCLSDEFCGEALYFSRLALYAKVLMALKCFIANQLFILKGSQVGGSAESNLQVLMTRG